MRARAFAWLGLLLAPVLLAAPTASHAGAFEDAVLSELNKVRANPQAYARELRRAEFVRASYAEQTLSVAQEDPDAVEDAMGTFPRNAKVQAMGTLAVQRLSEGLDDAPGGNEQPQGQAQRLPSSATGSVARVANVGSA